MSRLHVLAVPHTSTTEAHAYCAFTTDCRDFATMMTLRGHEVFLYTGPENEALVTEHVPLVDAAWQVGHFGPFSDDRLFPNNLFDGNTPWWWEWNARAIAALSQRLQPGDLILPINGGPYAATIDCFRDRYVVAEWMVGYPPEQRYTRNANYVSYAWRNHCEGQQGMCFAGWADSVIANPFARPDWKERDDQGYLLFVGRKNQSKGLHVFNDLCLRTGRQGFAAGQGPWDLAPDVEHTGVVLGEDKRRLLEHAHRLVVPSIYVEPFGKIVIEANLLGTPVITSDFGAFSETVVNGFNGYRCRTMKEFVEAVDAPVAESEEIAAVAAQRYAFDPRTGEGRPGLEMERWFERLQQRTWYDGLDDVAPSE